MTPETANNIAEAFREHRDAFGVSITFKDQPPIVAIVGEAEFGRELSSGGYAETGDISCKFLLAELPAAPAIGDLVAYNERFFRVSSYANQPGGQVGECNLRPAKR